MKIVCRYKTALELIFRSIGVDPEREFKFHPSRRWKIDYAFPGKKIAIEYEGMAYNSGKSRAYNSGKSRHTTISGFTADAEKYNEISLAGYTLLRFNAEMVRNGTALRQIKAAFSD